MAKNGELLRARFVLYSVAVIALVATPVRSYGQLIWTEASMIGYGGLGLGTGYAVGLASADDWGSFLLTVGGLTIGGAVYGAKKGGAAESKVSRGDTLSSNDLFLVRVGTVSGFASLGYVAGKYRTRESTSSKEDIKATERKYLLLGAAVGAVVEVFQEKWVRQRMRENDLRVGLGRAPGGEMSVRVALLFD